MFEAVVAVYGLENGMCVYDSSSRAMANALANIEVGGELPVPMGVFFQTERETFESTVEGINSKQLATKDESSVDETLSDLFNSGNTWAVG